MGGKVKLFILICVCSFFQAPVSPLDQIQTLLLQLLPHRGRRCQASPSPCLLLLPSLLHHGHLYHHFLPSVSTTIVNHMNNDKTKYIWNESNVVEVFFVVVFFKARRGLMYQDGFNQGCFWISLSVNVNICHSWHQSKSVYYLFSPSVIDASPSSLSVSTVWGGAEGHGGRGKAGTGGQATMSPEHPHPPGRRHAQHPPLPQHRHHTRVTAIVFPRRRTQIQSWHSVIKHFIWNLHCTPAVVFSPPRADGGVAESGSSHVHSSPVVGSSTDIQSQESTPSCEYTQEVSQDYNLSQPN